jgi:hypothetical protein
MTDRPIIFSAPMVRALLDGRKTQTRRALKPPYGTLEYLPDRTWRPIYTKCFRGDRLYVREAFCPRLGYPAPVATPHYRADDDKPEWRGLWKPSIHMPRWASRLTLTVTDVRVQRLQEISEADAIAEGCDAAFAMTMRRPNGAYPGNATECFRDLWNSLHGPDAWDANPWVAALTFTVQRGNIDSIGPTAGRDQ